MSVYVERLWILAGLLIGAWALVSLGFQLCLWALRTGRVDMKNVKRWTGNAPNARGGKPKWLVIL